MYVAVMVTTDSAQNHEQLEKNVLIRKIPRNSMIPASQEFMLTTTMMTM